MKLIGIGAIVVLLIVAGAAGYINSVERSRAVFDAVHTELSTEEAAPPSVSQEKQDEIQEQANLLRDAAAFGSLLDVEEAKEFRAKREALYRSVGAEFQMFHKSGFCGIEVRQPGVYTIHAWGRNGKAFSNVNWD